MSLSQDPQGVLDLSQNEFAGYMALALEGNGLPQGLCKPAAQAALAIATSGSDPTDRALAWCAGDAATILAQLADMKPSPGRVTSVSAQNWVRIKQLAAKTYVPESEASKLGGAGAGLTDND